MNQISQSSTLHFLEFPDLILANPPEETHGSQLTIQEREGTGSILRIGNVLSFFF